MSNKRIFALIAALLVLVVALAGCGQAAAPEAAAENPPAAEEQPSESAGGASDADLSITGLVGSEQALARADLEAMDTIEVVTTNKDGEEKTYSGVLISALLDKAAVQDGATTIVFIADDGYEVERLSPTSRAARTASSRLTATSCAACSPASRATCRSRGWSSCG